jgi:excisionase family DNA binding protein
VPDQTRVPLAPDPQRWLSLGPASRLLGVDPDTLRRWADTGRVRVYTTPGGHRRFERATLERLAADRPGRPARPLADLGASRERLARVYRRRYATEPPTAPSGTQPAGSAAADAVDRESFRQDGRRLLTALVAYLDAGSEDAAGRADAARAEAARAAAEAEAVAIVEGQARRSVAAGLGLPDAVAAFVRARQPFLNEIVGLGRRRSLDQARLASLVVAASAVLDRLLLRFMDAHRAASDEGR